MTPTNQPALPDEAQDAEDARREAALAKIAEIDEELGLYDDEAQGDVDVALSAQGDRE